MSALRLSTTILLPEISKAGFTYNGIAMIVSKEAHSSDSKQRRAYMYSSDSKQRRTYMYSSDSRQRREEHQF